MWGGRGEVRSDVVAIVAAAAATAATSATASIAASSSTSASTVGHVGRGLSATVGVGGGGLLFVCVACDGVDVGDVRHRGSVIGRVA